MPAPTADQPHQFKFDIVAATTAVQLAILDLGDDLPIAMNDLLKVPRAFRILRREENKLIFKKHK